MRRQQEEDLGIARHALLNGVHDVIRNTEHARVLVKQARDASLLQFVHACTTDVIHEALSCTATVGKEEGETMWGQARLGGVLLLFTCRQTTALKRTVQ